MTFQPVHQIEQRTVIVPKAYDIGKGEKKENF
jgi:hypothetical protein